MPGVLTEPVLRKPKKLIVCCDGTWMNSDSQLQVPTNVTRISRAIECEDSRSSPQVVYYQAGVGTGAGWTDQILGGGTGLGLAEHIREAYSFLANNYAPGGLIYLIGFSRGAFTARSLGGLIGQLGLLNKKGLEYFYETFEDWEHAGYSRDGPIFLKKYRDEVTGQAYTLKTPGNEPKRAVEYLREYRALLRSLGLTHRAPTHNNPSEEISIQAVACWDTVGALGIPVNPTLQKWLDFPAFFRVRQLKWMDTTLTDNVLNAFHALALDEHRAPFSPAVWEKPEGCTTNLKQVWFPGAHSGVGGGYDDTATADISLAWMMDQLSGNSSDKSSPEDADKWIDFNDDYLLRLHDKNNDFHESNLTSRNWGNGAIVRSMKFPHSLAGYVNRTPGRYQQLDSITCKPKEGVLLRETNEYVHASVRARLDLGGHGPVDDAKRWNIWSYLFRLVHKILGRTGQRFYRPAALEGWVLKDGHKKHDELALNNVHLLCGGGVQPLWEWRGKDAYVEQGTRMYEDRLGKYELQLLRRFEDVCDEIEASNLGLESVATLQLLHKQSAAQETRRSVTV